MRHCCRGAASSTPAASTDSNRRRRPKASAAVHFYPHLRRLPSISEDSPVYFPRVPGREVTISSRPTDLGTSRSTFVIFTINQGLLRHIADSGPRPACQSRSGPRGSSSGTESLRTLLAGGVRSSTRPRRRWRARIPARCRGRYLLYSDAKSAEEAAPAARVSYRLRLSGVMRGVTVDTLCRAERAADRPRCQGLVSIRQGRDYDPGSVTIEIARIACRVGRAPGTPTPGRPD